jgi:hypothetical protein
MISNVSLSQKGVEGKIMKGMLRWVTVALVFLIVVSCSNAMQLAYPKPQPLVPVKGEVSVKIDDQRISERGGDEPLKVGIVRNTFGMPFALMASPDREPTKVMRELLSDCLAASGYKIVDASPQTPQLHAVLKVFWSDGYQHSRMGLLMPIALKRVADTASPWNYTVDINTGKTWGMGGFSQFNGAFNKMLEEAKDDLLEQFAKPEFEEAYLSLR